MEQGIFSQNLKISSLNMEIAAEIIRSGLAWKIIQKKETPPLPAMKFMLPVFRKAACEKSPITSGWSCRTIFPEGCVRRSFPAGE